MFHILFYKSTYFYSYDKTFIFKGIIWNSLLIINMDENGYHARFIQNGV